MPAVTRVVGEPGRVAYGVVGMGAALTISTLAGAAAFIEAPRTFYAFLIPMVITNLVFGFLSGFVTFHLMKMVPRLRQGACRRGRGSGRPTPLIGAGPSRGKSR